MCKSGRRFITRALQAQIPKGRRRIDVSVQEITEDCAAIRAGMFGKDFRHAQHSAAQLRLQDRIGRTRGVCRDLRRGECADVRELRLACLAAQKRRELRRQRLALLTLRVLLMHRAQHQQLIRAGVAPCRRTGPVRPAPGVLKPDQSRQLQLGHDGRRDLAVDERI